MIYVLLDLFFKLSLMDKDIFIKYYSIIKNQNLDNSCKSLFRKIDNYMSKYLRVPTYDFFIDIVEELKRKNNSFEYNIKRYEEPLQYYYEKFVQKCKIYYKEQISRFLLEDNNEDINILLNKYNRLIKDLDFESTDIFVKGDIDNFIEEFKKIRDSGDEGLIPTGFNIIDSFSGGIQRGDYILFVSRPQSFKTWIMCQLAINFSRIIRGGKILFFSKEMSKVQILKRLIAIAGNINYESIKRHRLNDNRLIELKESIINTLDSEIIIVGKEQDIEYNPLYVRNKIVEYNPDVVIIDGLYLFAKSDEWENHSKISRVFRDISLTYNVPIIGTLQFSRRGLGRGNVAYSDSYEQDASMFIGMERQQDDNGNLTNEVNLSILKIRDGKVDVKSKIVADFENTIFKEMAITDISSPVKIKKVDSISRNNSSAKIEILKDSIKRYFANRVDSDIKKDEIRDIVLRDLGKDVQVITGKDGLVGHLSRNRDDKFYYFQVGSYMFRIYSSDKMYVNFYKVDYKLEVDPLYVDFALDFTNFSESMINQFLKSCTKYFYRGSESLDKVMDILNRDKRYSFNDLSIELLENYLKKVFEFQDPITNILILIKGNMNHILFQDIENSYLRETLQDMRYNSIMKYYTLNIFYDYNFETNTFELKNEFKVEMKGLYLDETEKELLNQLEDSDLFNHLVFKR
ncbi:MAG: hypothetical protein KatS3mg068_1510 [Candidatus Sericytochromatia bacterium]|nr:MAG: hypothetical protein KatS3mg068_1510 [Candidatus Sericytochromatia bacterium]